MSILYLPWPFGDFKITIPDFVYTIINLPCTLIHGKKKTNILDKMIEKEQDDDQRLLLESYEEFATEQLNFVAEDDVNFDGSIAEKAANDQIKMVQPASAGQSNAASAQPSPNLNQAEIELEINQQELHVNNNNNNSNNKPEPIDTNKPNQVEAVVKNPLQGENDKPTPKGGFQDGEEPTPASATINVQTFGDDSPKIDSQEHIIYASNSFYQNMYKNHDIANNNEDNAEKKDENVNNNNDDKIINETAV